MIIGRSAIVGLALALFGAAPALAEGIQADDGWARARIPNARAGAAYLVLTNSGTRDDRLVSASSPIASVVEVHRHLHDNGVMRMEHLPELPLPAGEAVTFKPGGLHLMLIGLQQQLKQGTTFPVTLTFVVAPPVTVSVEVLSIAAKGLKR